MSFMRALMQMICGKPSPGSPGSVTVPATPPAPAKPQVPILDQFDAIASAGGSPQEIALRQAGFARTQIRDNALPFFQELRDHRPILQAGPVWLVSRFRDVEEILHRETVFGVPYLPNMTGVIGPFVLSQDLTPAYDHDISAMRLAIRRADLPRIQQIVARHAGQIVEGLAATGQPFDIVQTLTRIVPLRVAEEYFGFKAPDDLMKRWARAAFEEFFVNLDQVPAVREAAIQAGAESHAALAALIAERRASAAQPDDVLGRLLAQQQAGGGLCLDDEGVIRTLQGCLIGMDETTNQACNAALLVLLARPPLLAAAQAAARADQDEKLAAIVFEALRFRPINPLVVRKLKQSYTLGAGEAHATTLPAGATVFNLTWSAMFDERVLEAPTEFKPGRPASHYLHFGSGHHACFGRYISQVQIPQILKPLLVRDGLKLAGAPELAGVMQVFPDKVVVAVDG